MKITPKKSKFVSYAIVAAVVLAGLTIGGLLYAQSQQQDSSNKKQSKPSKSDIDNDPGQKQSALDTKEQTVNNSGKNNGTSSDSTEGDALSVSLSAHGKNGDTYQLRYLIEQPLASGACELTLTNDSKTIIKSVPIQALASSSTCQGFNIDMSDLGSGTWTASLTVQSDNKTGKTSDIIEI